MSLFSMGLRHSHIDGGG